MFVLRHSMFKSRHGVFIWRQSMFILRHSIFKSRHGMFIWRQSMFILRHSMFKSRHGMFVWRHSMFILRHRMFKTDTVYLYGDRVCSFLGTVCSNRDAVYSVEDVGSLCGDTLQ